jgi:SsrA-binding protein
MKKQRAKSSGTIANRRARHDYDLGDSLVVGIALSGAETKALRTGHGHLRGAYVTLKNNELWLPLEILTKGRYIKLRISAGRGKKQYDKRATLKARDETRQANAAIKAHNR